MWDLVAKVVDPSVKADWLILTSSYFVGFWGDSVDVFYNALRRDTSVVCLLKISYSHLGDLDCRMQLP